jgi:hypothetical protein
MFEVALRLLMCEWCGAAIKALPEGGVFSCDHCQAKLVLEARITGVTSSGVPETERLELLAQQVDQDHSRGVTGFSHLVRDGLHDPDRVEESIAEWNRARADLLKANTPQAADRFFVFSKVVADQLPDLERKRAVLETAAELLPNGADCQVMCARLSRAASNAGELDAAERWLERCDPRSSSIEADTEYRISHARLQLARANYLGVFQGLGLRDGLVPIHSRGRMIAAIYRAEAYERLNDLQSAVGELLVQARRSSTRLRTLTEGRFCQRSLELAVVTAAEEA